jgi:hypothetical protein
LIWINAAGVAKLTHEQTILRVARWGELPSGRSALTLKSQTAEDRGGRRIDHA